MFDIFNKPPNKWNGMDYAEINMLTNGNNQVHKKSSSGCSGCGCLTAVIAVIAMVAVFISFII